MKIKHFTYTKDNGDISNRVAVMVSSPRENYLVYDVTDFTDKELHRLEVALDHAEAERDKAIADFELLTGKQLNRLWRSFKPGGIEWTEGNEVQISK
jgi:hypothetical protein